MHEAGTVRTRNLPQTIIRKICALQGDVYEERSVLACGAVWIYNKPRGRHIPEEGILQLFFNIGQILF
jgi:hypothetical protein